MRRTSCGYKHQVHAVKNACTGSVCLIQSHRSLNSDRDTGLVSGKTLALAENLDAWHLNEGSSRLSDRDTGRGPSPSSLWTLGLGQGAFERGPHGTADLTPHPVWGEGPWGGQSFSFTFRPQLQDQLCPFKLHTLRPITTFLQQGEGTV